MTNLIEPHGGTLCDLLVPNTQKNKILKDLKSGNINLIIGTHALLSKSIEYKNLGLIIIDEEQHFGVN